MVMQEKEITARLNDLREQIEKGKTELARAEANLETYTEQRDSLVAEMKEYSVTPETVDAEIGKLEKEIQEKLKEAEELLEG